MNKILITQTETNVLLSVAMQPEGKELSYSVRSSQINCNSYLSIITGSILVEAIVFISFLWFGDAVSALTKVRDQDKFLWRLCLVLKMYVRALSQIKNKTQTIFCPIIDADYIII